MSDGKSGPNTQNLPRLHPWLCVDCGRPFPGRQFQATPFAEDRCVCGGKYDGGWKDE